MIPDETGISFPLDCSLPSSTASLCARILLPIGELLLALCGESAEPATANATRAASGSRPTTTFFILSPFLGQRPTTRPTVGVGHPEIYESPVRTAKANFLKEASGSRNTVV